MVFPIPLRRDLVELFENRRIGAKPVRGWVARELSGDALIALAEGAGNG